MEAQWQPSLTIKQNNTATHLHIKDQSQEKHMKLQNNEIKLESSWEKLESKKIIRGIVSLMQLLSLHSKSCKGNIEDNSVTENVSHTLQAKYWIQQEV